MYECVFPGPSKRVWAIDYRDRSGDETLLGTLLALVGWLAVVRWRYPGGWPRAAVTAVVAWVAPVVVLALLELLGVRAPTALGVPGARVTLRRRLWSRSGPATPISD